jgi:hypothetical protein
LYQLCGCCSQGKALLVRILTKVIFFFLLFMLTNRHGTMLSNQNLWTAFAPRFSQPFSPNLYWPFAEILCHTPVLCCGVTIPFLGRDNVCDDSQCRQRPISTSVKQNRHWATTSETPGGSPVITNTSRGVDEDNRFIDVDI